MPSVATMSKPSCCSRSAGRMTARLSRSATETNTVPLGRQAAVRGILALRERRREVAVDAHDLAGGAHLRAEHRVDDVALLGAEALERQHGLLHRDRRVQRHARAVALGQQPLGRSARRCVRADHDAATPPWRAGCRAPSTRTAPCGSPAGSPRARRARPAPIANCTLSRPRTPTPSAMREGRVAHPVDVGRGRASRAAACSAESPEWMPASSMCSMTPPMYSSVAVVERVDVDLDRVVEEAVDQQRRCPGR